MPFREKVLPYMGILHVIVWRQSGLSAYHHQPSQFPRWRLFQFFWCCFVFLLKFSYWSKFHVNIIPNFGVLTILFCKGLTWNRKIVKLLSKFCWILEDWTKLGIPNLAQTSLINYYWMLQNARVTAFTISKLLRKNQQRGWVKLPQD